MHLQSKNIHPLISIVKKAIFIQSINLKEKCPVKKTTIAINNRGNMKGLSSNLSGYKAMKPGLFILCEYTTGVCGNRKRASLFKLMTPHRQVKIVMLLVYRN